ncbi:MAG: hypothetical protein AAB295_11405, partial [Chloroflexota bacterium]
MTRERLVSALAGTTVAFVLVSLVVASFTGDPIAPAEPARALAAAVAADVTERADPAARGMGRLRADPMIDPSPDPTAAPTPEPTPAPTPEPTPEPTPTPAPAPAPTPRPTAAPVRPAVPIVITTTTTE